MNIATIISLICFTVFGLGTTTKVVLDFLHKHFPEDKVYKNPNDLEDSDKEDDGVSVDFEYPDYIEGNDTKSMGAVSRFENFDRNVLQNLLRKDKKLDDYDPLGERFLPENEIAIPIEETTSYKDSQDMQPRLRASIMHNKGIPKKVPKVQFSLPVEDPKNRNTEFLSPESQKQSARRSTIRHDKIASDVLRKYSIIAAGKNLKVSWFKFLE